VRQDPYHFRQLAEVLLMFLNSRLDLRQPIIDAVCVLVVIAMLALSCSAVRGQSPQLMQLPSEVRAWYRNPDGSCVQCSIGMCGVWNNVPAASTLLWDTPYGPAVRGGSWPGRVAEYCDRRGIAAFNVTGSETWQWMEWAAKTGRFAAIGAGTAHFQTEYGRDREAGRWYVCNNNSTNRVDEYSEDAFRRLHLASGQWVVILDGPAPPAPPRYVQWWASQ